MPTYAIVGASGKVGHATAEVLRKTGAQVRAIVRDYTKATALTAIGCEIASADLHDVTSLSKAFEHVDAVQLILPVNPALQHPVQDMHRTMDCLEAALKTTKPARILLISDYGAHVKHDIGLPSIFHSFEGRLSTLDGHKIFLRSAEHMQNVARSIPLAVSSGIFSMMHERLDDRFPTISAHDLGSIAAEVLLSSTETEGVRTVHAEGPQRYSAEEIAEVLGRVLDRKVVAASIPRGQWVEKLGGLDSCLVELIVKANDAQNRGGLVDIEPDSQDVRRGTTDLEETLRSLL